MCLIELHLEFELSFQFYSSYISLLFLLFISNQLITYYRNDRISYVRLEHLTEPGVSKMEEGIGYEW